MDTFRSNEMNEQSLEEAFDNMQDYLNIFQPVKLKDFELKDVGKPKNGEKKLNKS